MSNLNLRHILLAGTCGTSLLLFSGCTWKMARVGIRDSALSKASKLVAGKDEVLLEFEGIDVGTFKRRRYFWTTISRGKLFENTDFQNAADWPLNYGPIPKRIMDKWPKSDSCISTEDKQITFNLDGGGYGQKRIFYIRDSCAQKEARLEFYGKTHRDSAAWRPFVRPFAILTGVVTDIVLSPVYLGYYIKCISLGCAK